MPPRKFKINPTKDNPFLKEIKKLYIEVVYFENKEEMYKYYKDKMEGYHKLNFGAIVQPTSEIFNYTKDGAVIKKSNKIATVLFCPTNDEGKLGGSVVTHECVHLAFATLRYLGKKLDLDNEDCNDEEEQLAYLIQSIYRQIVVELFKHNIW